MSLESEIKRRRTFGIISHPDAGKTTLTEKLLLFGGAIQEAGAVKSNKITSSIYRGNTRSFVFHRNTCEHFNCKNCIETFQRRDEAIAAGFRPCGKCRP